MRDIYPGGGRDRIEVLAELREAFETYLRPHPMRRAIVSVPHPRDRVIKRLEKSGGYVVDTSGTE